VKSVGLQAIDNERMCVQFSATLRQNEAVSARSNGLVFAGDRKQMWLNGGNSSSVCLRLFEENPLVRIGVIVETKCRKWYF